jgi:hypothetical protein
MPTIYLMIYLLILTGMMSIPINQQHWAQQNLKSEKIIAKVKGLKRTYVRASQFIAFF